MHRHDVADQKLFVGECEVSEEYFSGGERRFKSVEFKSGVVEEALLEDKQEKLGITVEDNLEIKPMINTIEEESEIKSTFTAEEDDEIKTMYTAEDDQEIRPKITVEQEKEEI